MAISIYKAGPSQGAINLKNGLRATLLKSQGSRYTPRDGKVLVNWGSSGPEAVRLCGMTQPHLVLNQPVAVGRAANKLECFRTLVAGNVQTVPWFDTLENAVGHAAAGRIYVRTRLTGHGGEGIHLIMSEGDPQADEAQNLPYPVHFAGEMLPAEVRNARLFTVGITGRRNEWRIHVFKGRVILNQLKMRRQGFQELEGYTSLVRNVEAGWIYSVHFEQDQYPQLTAMQELATNAVATLGLDFGAVDIVERRGEGFVLEVNTAPGLGEEGSALTAYCDAIRGYEGRVRG